MCSLSLFHSLETQISLCVPGCTCVPPLGRSDFFLSSKHYSATRSTELWYYTEPIEKLNPWFFRPSNVTVEGQKRKKVRRVTHYICHIAFSACLLTISGWPSLLPSLYTLFSSTVEKSSTFVTNNRVLPWTLRSTQRIARCSQRCKV